MCCAFSHYLTPVPSVVWWSQADACLHLIHNSPANFSFIITATICFVLPLLIFIFPQVHKANPIRKYRSLEVKSSHQPLTVPKSPNFSDRFRIWWASTSTWHLLGDPIPLHSLGRERGSNCFSTTAQSELLCLVSLLYWVVKLHLSLWPFSSASWPCCVCRPHLL